MYFKIYRAVLVECEKCGSIATYWSRHHIIRIYEARQRALADGWIVLAQLTVCPECALKGK